MTLTIVGIRHQILVAIDNKNKKTNNWTSYIRDFFLINDTDDLVQRRDYQRLIDYLEHSCKALTNFFKVSLFFSLLLLFKLTILDGYSISLNYISAVAISVA